DLRAAGDPERSRDCPRRFRLGTLGEKLVGGAGVVLVGLGRASARGKSSANQVRERPTRFQFGPELCLRIFNLQSRIASVVAYPTNHVSHPKAMALFIPVIFRESVFSLRSEFLKNNVSNPSLDL